MLRTKLNPKTMRLYGVIVATLLTVAPISYIVGSYISYQSQIQYPKSKSAVLHPANPWIGAYLDGGYWSRFWFDNASDVHLNSLLSFRALGQYPTFDLRNYVKYQRNGIVPLVSLEPWDPQAGKFDPQYSLAKLNAGAYDRQLSSWAVGLRKFSKPVMLRFAHEMNGPWYPWGVTVNGNKPGDYVKAWHHVHDIFVRHHANNVLWVWSPNVSNRQGHIPLKSFYPGDNYVDMVGLVGYYKNKTDTFSSIFSNSIRELSTFTSKPLLLTETGVSRYLANPKAKIQDLFDGIAKHSNIVGVYWFQKDKRFPWALARPEEFTAFRDGVDRMRRNWSTGSSK